MEDQGMDARVAEDHLKSRSCSRITLEDGIDVLA